MGFAISDLRGLKDVDIDLPSKAVVALRVDSEPRVGDRTVQFEATLLSVADSVDKKSFEYPYPRLIVSTGRDNYGEKLTFGDYIMASASLYEVENNKNPFEFDYREYLRRKNIYNRAYLTGYTIGDSDLIVRDQTLRDRARSLQHNIVAEIDSVFYDSDHKALVSSLLIGYRDELSDDVRDMFSNVGLSHILAVSGLHIGFIYMILLLLFFPLLVNRFRRVGYFLIVFTLWVYAFVTGLSPSVIRATAMISILIVGKLLYLPYNSRNALFYTAITMLCYNPMYIYDVGFQLSFMAVWSIIIFYAKVKRLIDRCLGRIPLINRLSSVVSLSISAQILTLPLSVYYFDIIPIWFLLANVLVVPILPFVVGLSAMAVVLSFVGVKFGLLVSVVTMLLEFILWVGEKVSSLPMIRGMSLNMTILLIGYLMIFSWVVYMNRPKVKSLTNVMLFCVIGFVYITIFGMDRPVDELVVFNHYQKNDIHVFLNCQHKEVALGYVDSVKLDYSNIGYFKHYGYDYNSLRDDSAFIDMHRPFISIASYKFCVLYDDVLTARHRSESRVEVDYLMVGDSVGTSLYDLNKLVSFDSLVILPSLKAYQRVSYLEQADSLHIPYFDIKKEGAFRLPLN